MYEQVNEKMADTFKSYGVEVVETVGKEFDYSCHDAIMRQPGSGFEEGVVCSEFQKGYKLGELLIRPAMVAVSAG